MSSLIMLQILVVRNEDRVQFSSFKMIALRYFGFIPLTSKQLGKVSMGRYGTKNIRLFFAYLF